MASATIYLTGECNLRCRHCFVGHDQLAKRSPLTTEEVDAVLLNLRSAGTTTITLIGGEVTTHRADLPHILSTCDRLGLNVSINTNLTYGATLPELLDHPSLNNIVVSIDGVTAASHDRLRGRGAFDRTLRNLASLSRNERVATGSIAVDLTFVLNAFNKHEIFDLVGFYKENKFRKLNFKTMQYNDRAEANKSKLCLSPKELLDCSTAFYYFCLFEGGIQLDMHIPPAFGLYLDKILHAPKLFWNFNGCGGTEVYSYVDLYGNNVPCPAMSFEENRRTNIRSSSPALSLVLNPIKDVHQRSLFKGFDRSVAKKHRNKKMHPCRQCRFSDECSPCTNEIIRGHSEGIVDICSAVLTHGGERVPGIVREIFEKTEFQPDSVDRAEQHSA